MKQTDLTPAEGFGWEFGPTATMDRIRRLDRDPFSPSHAIFSQTPEGNWCFLIPNGSAVVTETIPPDSPTDFLYVAPGKRFRRFYSAEEVRAWYDANPEVPCPFDWSASEKTDEV